MLTRKPAESGVARHCLQLADQLADAAPELQRTTRTVAMPERHLARLSRCWRNQYAVVGNLVDSPGGCAKNECVSGAALEDHLLIQLAHPDGLGIGAREENSIQPTIRDCPAIQDRKTLSALARRDRIAIAVPGESGPQFSKLIGWIPASSEEVATRARILPAFKSSSISERCEVASDP